MLVKELKNAAGALFLQDKVFCGKHLMVTASIVFCLLLLFSVLFIPAPMYAKVTGSCNHCHTMHNSQNGAPMAKDDAFNPTSTPNKGLLIYSCIGCHTSTNGTTWKDAVTGAPIVFNIVAPTYGANGLAGGNFYYVVNTNQNTGHNVQGIAAADSILGNMPPGGSSALGGQITCAGTNGCHGHNGRQSGDTAQADQTVAVKGGHHGNDAPPLSGSLTDVSQNYRYLLNIKGKEDANWEQGNVNTSHNEYKGAVGFGDATTMSYFCGQCHGNFHSTTGVGSASPWVRHPTDIALKSTGEYTNYTAYSMVAPVARPNPDSVTNTTVVTPGADIIMCLSCHRAHASPYYKALRWNVKGTLSDAISGCIVCHTSKN